MLEVRDAGYRVWFDPKTATVFFEGSLRLNTHEYEPIWGLLQESLAQSPERLTLHLRELAFLNSSGINTLYKFAIALRKQGGVKLTVLASSAISWQGKSLPNVKKFLPTAELAIS
jgi:hypothetical protein